MCFSFFKYFSILERTSYHQEAQTNCHVLWFTSYVLVWMILHQAVGKWLVVSWQLDLMVLMRIWPSEARSPEQRKLEKEYLLAINQQSLRAPKDIKNLLWNYETSWTCRDLTEVAIVLILNSWNNRQTTWLIR